MYIEPGDFLKKGKKHPKNTQAQKELRALGYDLGTGGPNEDGVDGEFGSKTKKAVEKFQKANGLKEDGKIGPQTGAMLNEKYCTWLEGELAKERKKNQQDGDKQDGDKQDGDKQDGDQQDGDQQDGDQQDGDQQDGDQQDGDQQDGDKQDGDKQDGDQQGGAPPRDADSALTDEQLKQLRANAEKWKKDPALCKRNSDACKAAIEWVVKNGRFAPPGKDKTFAKAMDAGGGKSIAAALRLAKLFGILAQESSFGTNLGKPDKYQGPFQLGEAVVKDFNKHNKGQNIKWPDDIDEVKDTATAAKVAAWYLAFILQQLTFKDNGKFKDPDEANKFALAAYNGGLGTINKARKAAKDKGKDPNKWSDVKGFLPGISGDAKAKEIADYVGRIREYERLAKILRCV